MENMLDQMELNRIYERGLINHGSLSRFMRVMDKGVAGEELTIGFIGGSITAGSLSTMPESCYAYLVYSWWKRRFPWGKVFYRNAGIGATTSQFGVARIEEELLCDNPDVIFIEFSVNDLDNDFFRENFEGLVRRALLYRSAPALFIINNIFYDDGHNAQRIHNQIGNYYDLPIVSMRESVYEEIRRGKLSRDSITPDRLHPNDQGHALIAEMVIHHLEKIYSEFLRYNLPGKVDLVPDKPLTPNRFYNAVWNHNANFTPVLSGFIADTTIKAGNWDVFRGGWYGYITGDSLRFQVDCSCISLQFRKYAVHPAPIAKAVIDGDEDHAILLDANFSEAWGDCLYLQDILMNGPRGQHIIEITITQEAGDKAFYLASIITV